IGKQRVLRTEVRTNRILPAVECTGILGKSDEECSRCVTFPWVFVVDVKARRIDSPFEGFHSLLNLCLKDSFIGFLRRVYLLRYPGVPLCRLNDHSAKTFECLRPL